MLNKAKLLLAKAIRSGVEQIPDNASMKSLPPWDSLTHMELIVLIEEEIGRQLTFDEIVICTTLEGVLQIINLKKS